MSKKETKHKEENVEETEQKEQTEQTVEEAAREEKLSELDILKQSLEEKQKLADEYKDKYVRLAAEFENFRKRNEKEKQDYLNWGREKILSKQINIYDVFEQAMISVRAGQDLNSIKVGLEMIYSEFSKMLKEEGVEKIECLNKKFDPNFCEALDQVENEEVEEDTVLAVYQNGYKLNGKLMRPARVKVSKKAKKEEDKVVSEESVQEDSEKNKEGK